MRKGQQRSRNIRKGNSWASFRKNTLCGHYRGRAGGSLTSHLHQEQKAALAEHPLGYTVSWALPAHKEWPGLSLLSMPLSSCCDDIPFPFFQSSPQVPCCCLLGVSPIRAPCCLSQHFHRTKLYSLLVAFLTAYLLYSHLSFILPSGQRYQPGSQVSPYFLTHHPTTWDVLRELSSDSCFPFQTLAPGLLCTESFRNKPAHVSQTKEQLGKSVLPFMHIGDIWEITFLNCISLW